MIRGGIRAWRWPLCALLLSAFLFSCGAMAAAQEPEEKTPALVYTTDLPEGMDRLLSDGRYQTDVLPGAGTVFTLRAQEPIGSLYILYGTYPEPWTLSAGDRKYRCAQQGYLHEFIPLDEPSAELTFALPEQELRLCEIYVFPPGPPPDWVQIWQTLEEPADLLVFSTHADDELLFLGGTIPYYSAVRGLKVQVVYMTTNYFAVDDYRFRPHECLDGLWAAGAKYYPVTNMVGDAGAESLWLARRYYGEDGFTAFQTEQLRRFRPLVTVTLSESGEYGHGAHILTALSLEQAVIAAADPAQYPESAARWGVWDTPKTYLHSYGPAEEMTVLNFEEPSEALGGLTPLEAAQQAYKLHLTQQQWNFRVYSFGTAWDCHRYGLYRSLVGEDTERNDLMEHVSRELFPAP